MDEECDRCGAKFPPHEIGQNHGYTHLCEPCANLMREKYDALPMPSVDLVNLPPGLHVRHGRIIGVPRDYSKDVLFMSIVNDPNDFSPSVDLVTEPDHIVTGPPADDEDDEDDQMTPLEDRSTWPAHEPDMGEPVGFNPELDAPPLNAANIMAEIRRMS